MTDPRFAYHGKYNRMSFYLLTLWFPFGFAPLAVWLTNSGATVLNLVVAIVVGGPLLAGAFYCLFKYRALVVFAEERRLVAVDGFFRWRRSRSRSFDEVLLLRARYDTRDQADHGSLYLVEVQFRDGETFIMEVPTLEAGRETVLNLASVFKVQGYLDDKRIADHRSIG